MTALKQRSGGRYELVRTRDQLDCDTQTGAGARVFHIPVDQPPAPPQERIMTTVASKLVLAVAGLVASVTGFAATPDVDAPSVKVRYDDLNLATTAGANTLYRRISAAARDVCPDLYSRDPHVVLAAQRCQSAAIAKAVSEVNSPSLAMLHASRASRG
jgi:UrcA family protein